MLLIISSNRHQLEKANILSNYSPSNSKIWHLGPENSINSKIGQNVSKFKNLLACSAKELNGIQVIFLFTCHCNIHNIKFIDLARSLGIKLIGIQESHQLGLQNTEIFNLTLALDYIVSANEIEKDLIRKNNLFPEDKIFSIGWMFSNHKTYQNMPTNKNILVFLGASKMIAPTSNESIDTWNALINYLTIKFPKKLIMVKPHPQEINAIHKLFRNSVYKNIRLIQEDINPIELSHDYKHVYISDKSQTFLDLVFQHKKCGVYSSGVSNLYFNNIDSEVVKIGNQLILKYCDSDSVLPLRVNNMLDVPSNPRNLFKIINELPINEENIFVQENKLWLEFLTLNRAQVAQCFLGQQIQDLEKFCEFIQNSNTISFRSLIFFCFIQVSRSQNLKSYEIHQLFINKIFIPINISNFPYESIRYFIFLRKLKFEELLDERIEIMLVNIINSFMNKSSFGLIKNGYGIFCILLKNFIFRLLFDRILKVKSI